MSNKKTIIKVQKPFMTNDPNVPWLIYDRKRQHEEQLPDRLVPNYVRKIMEKTPKAYFEGTWSSIVGWAIGQKVKDQEW